MYSQVFRNTTGALSLLRIMAVRPRFLPAIILMIVAGIAPLSLMAQAPVPFVNLPLVPTSVAPGSAAFSLTVNGTGFSASSVVKWNGSPRTTTFVSGSQLRATILAADVSTAQTGSVTVTNPAPGGGTSNPVSFAVSKSTSATFMLRNDIAANASIQAVATADFRGIGKIDLAIANSNNSVDVRLGNGDGTFQAAVNYNLGSGFPIGVIAGDFNGDGKPDLAILLQHMHQVGIMIGNGDGTFTIGQRFNTGLNPLAFATGDFDGDGNLDLVTANFTDSTVSILKGNGDGTFQANHDYATGLKPVSVSVGDFNRDGALDLAVVNNADDTISILRNTGTGAFAAHVDYPSYPLPTWVASGDFNGDGKLDLAVSTASSYASIFLGNGDGTFNAHTDFKIGANSQTLLVADMNGDGKLDLAAANLSDNTVSVLGGVGDGTFKSQQLYLTSAGPESFDVGDFDGDGKLDLAVADTDGHVTILSQTPLWVSPTTISFPLQQGGFATSPVTVTLRNTGTTGIGLETPIKEGTNAGDFSQTNNCANTVLASNATCTFQIVFTPQDIGKRSAQIRVPLTSGGSVGIALYGTGRIVVAIEPNPHAFPTTLLGTPSAAFHANFRNFSNLPVTIQPFVFTGINPDAYSITNNQCPLTVGPLVTCYLDVIFKPVRVGSNTAALTVFGHFSPGNGQQAILLSGIGTGVSVSPKSISYVARNVGTTSPARVVTVKNVNTVPLNVTISLQGANVPDFAQTNNCAPSIPAGGTCTINVTFTPLATGTRNATVNIGDSDPTGPQIITLTGIGQ